MALWVSTPTSSATYYYYDDGGNRFAKLVGSTLEYYLHDQSGRELAVIDLATGKLKQVNLFGNDQIGSVDVTWSGGNPTFTKQFDDGNGRGARILMNLILIEKGFPPAIIKNENWRKYIEALSEVDKGNLNKFTEFIAESCIDTQKTVLDNLK